MLKLILFIVSFSFCCKSNTTKDFSIVHKGDGISISIDSSNVSNLLLGINSEIYRNSILDSAVYFLNASKPERCLLLINSLIQIDTIFQGEKFGYIISKYNKKYISSLEKYIIFRVNEYFSNLENNELSIQLIRSFDNYNDSLSFLQKIELEYLECANSSKNIDGEKIISEFRNYQKKNSK